MPDLLSTASDWLASTFKNHVSQSVAYSRGDSEVEASATLGRAAYEVTDTSGFTTSAHFSDFVFTSADLDFGSGIIEPAPGDEIDFGGRTYEVQNVPGGRCYEYMDPERIGIRVHTRITSEGS